jgi:hypothetical protein
VFKRKQCWYNWANSYGTTPLAQLCTGLTMDYPSVKQGCVQVLIMRILLQTSFISLLSCCHRQRFVAVLSPNLFFGDAEPVEQVATREHPAYLISYLRLSRIMSTSRVLG